MDFEIMILLEKFIALRTFVVTLSLINGCDIGLLFPLPEPHIEIKAMRRNSVKIFEQAVKESEELSFLRPRIPPRRAESISVEKIKNKILHYGDVSLSNRTNCTSDEAYKVEASFFMTRQMI